MGPTTWDDVRRALALRPPTRVADPVASRAAVALILRETARGLELLFIRRAEHDGDPWSGQVGFPGGRAEPGEDDLRSTAVRETAEEIDLHLKAAHPFLGELDEVRAMARMRPMDLTVRPFVFELREPGAALRPSPEVTSLHWIPLDEIRGPRRRGTLDYDQEGTTLHFPCLRYEGLVIWGLTYRMFTNFQELLEAAVAEAPTPTLVSDPRSG
jgi:8-oxo-dGTP pyrophosphatase MutT (NUDIX family)